MTTPPVSRQTVYAEWVQVVRDGVCEGCSDDAIAARYPRIPPAFIVVISTALRRADTEAERANRAEREVRRLEAQQRAREHPYLKAIGGRQ